MNAPNIILLILDTQRADRLSCYGYPLPTSPHLDRLAAESTRFTHAIAPAQWTVPSHASIFTGRYPSEHTVLQLEYVLPATLPTLAERLSQAGYYTAGFCNNSMIGVLKNGLGRGFAHFINYASAEYRQGSQSQTGRLQGWLNKTLAAVEKAFVASRAARKIAELPWVWSLLAPIFWNDEDVKGDTAQSLADAAHMLIERPGVASNQPIFTFINLMGTHWPYDPPDWAVERFLPELEGQNIKAFVSEFNRFVRGLPEILVDPLTAEQERIMDGLYNAEVLGQDTQLGLFFKQLHSAGILDETFLMVVADHGEQLGEKCLVGHGYGAYQPLLHVPLLIRDPLGRFPAGTTAPEVISIRRLYHTTLHVAGVATAEEAALTLTVPAPTDTPVFGEAWPPESSYLRQKEHKAIEQQGYHIPHFAIYDEEGYKLIDAGGRCLGLFTPDFDRAEEQDLQHRLPHKVAFLQEQIEAHRQNSDAAPAERMQIEDPALMARLKALGYVE